MLKTAPENGSFYYRVHPTLMAEYLGYQAINTGFPLGLENLEVIDGKASFSICQGKVRECLIYMATGKVSGKLHKMT